MDVKNRLAELSERATARRMRYPANPSEESVKDENQNALDLMPYVYAAIGGVEDGTKTRGNILH